MTNPEQIIKGLEESVKKIEAHYDARNIPKDKRPSENKKALELIKGQKAEIERLNVVVGAMKGEIDGLNKDLNRWKDWYASLIEAQKRTVQGKQELIAQIENLAKENKYLRERLAEEMERKEDMSVEFTCVFGQPHKVSDCPITEEIDKAKADTVKRMQELIKERCIEGGIYPAFVASTIDKIAKEILEGTK